MLKVVKPHHYSKKEKSAFRRNNSWAVWRNTAEVRDIKTWSGWKKGNCKAVL